MREVGGGQTGVRGKGDISRVREREKRGVGGRGGKEREGIHD